jgi:hypothetical protein
MLVRLDVHFGTIDIFHIAHDHVNTAFGIIVVVRKDMPRSWTFVCLINSSELLAATSMIKFSIFSS